MVELATSCPFLSPVVLAYKRPCGVGGIGRYSRSFATWKTSGWKGASRCLTPWLLLGVGGGSRSELSSLCRVISTIRSSGEGKWPDMGLTMPIIPCLSLLCTGECHLSVHCFFCLFLCTRDGEWCWEEPHAREHSAWMSGYLALIQNGLALRPVRGSPPQEWPSVKCVYPVSCRV